MKNLIKTNLGLVDLSTLNHPKLLKVIRERCDSPSFLFNYGDYSECSGHDDHQESAKAHHEHHEAYNDIRHTDYGHKKYHVDDGATWDGRNHDDYHYHEYCEKRNGQTYNERE